MLQPVSTPTKRCCSIGKRICRPSNWRKHEGLMTCNASIGSWNCDPTKFSFIMSAVEWTEIIEVHLLYVGYSMQQNGQETKGTKILWWRKIPTRCKDWVILYLPFKHAGAWVVLSANFDCERRARLSPRIYDLRGEIVSPEQIWLYIDITGNAQGISLVNWLS